MRNQQTVTFIEAYPWLATLFGSPNPRRVAFTLLPLVAILGWMGWSLPLVTQLVLLASGAVYWTLVEYLLHRHFYHWRPRGTVARRLVESFHVYHHRNVNDRSVWNAGPLLIFPLTLLLSLPVLIVLRRVAATATLMLGAAAAFYIYEWTHHLIHARRFCRGPLAYLQGFHLHHHHRNARRCFGVTNPFWDMLFRTSVPRRAWQSAPEVTRG